MYKRRQIYQIAESNRNFLSELECSTGRWLMAACRGALCRFTLNIAASNSNDRHVQDGTDRRTQDTIRIDDTNRRSSGGMAVGCEGWTESWGPSAPARQFHGKTNINNFPRHFATSNQFTTVYVVRASCARGWNFQQICRFSAVNTELHKMRLVAVGAIALNPSPPLPSPL